ncbi:hypothetical protein FE257_005720 [Aspergillus nanangensis]|uniref:Zn(2)-C6 fungal-type domain-containing protein n=1 Tax=Aspergillus nanangensis TaxID=2582783 RepID=A0AAD4CQ33_ASPNN|nr:hypothetical protein FE257_005720 [Aspergillus nanangensis]
MQVNATENSNEMADGSNPRSKRAKYAAKACEYCHRRKIKCDGESPCAACRSKDRECVKDYVPTNRGSLAKKRKRLEDEELSNTEDEDESGSVVDCTTTLLVERVSGIERQLQQLISSLSSRTDPRAGVECAQRPRCEEPARQEDTTTRPHPSAAAAAADPEFGPAEEPSYVGETSISRTLQQVEDSLHELGLPAKNTPAAISPSSALLNEVGATSSSSLRAWILQTLDKHELQPDKAEWDVLLDLYCEDVYPLYPFLHIPSLRRSYAQLLGHNELGTAGKDSLAQVLICLGLGRCTTSVRAETSEGTQSSGWAFYTAALDCVGGILDPLRETSLGLQRLQVLALMIVYLIRIDANERAQKVLSLTIVQAQHLGLHREVIVKTAPTFIAECSRRLWWCLYNLDRRVALDIGQPFLIQDINTDTSLPLALSEEVLEGLYHRSSTSPGDETAPMNNNGDDNCQSPIPYVISMMGYSKIVGKAWNELYQAQCMDRASEPALAVSFEDLLSMWRQSLPPSLHCDEMHPHEHHPPDAPVRPWQLKNKFLIHIRMLWLRILIRKPMRSRSSPTAWIQNFDNEAVCISLADRIVAFYSRIFEPYRLYTFPFLQYLLGASSTILGLIIKVPVFRSRHTHSVIQAAQMMNTFCQKTWVSGKTLRSVKRFTDMMTEVVNQNTLRSSYPRNSSSRESDTVANGGLNITSGKSSWGGDRQNAFALPQKRTRSMPTTNHHGQVPRNNTDNADQVPEGDASYFNTLISPPCDHFDGLSFGSGLQSLTSFAPDLENLVMADYPFERSVSDKNWLQVSGGTYDDIAAAMNS